MKSPIILAGRGFDWDAGAEAMAHVQDADGGVNWGAAMMADPGVMKCPACAVFLWAEGRAVACPDCGHEWERANR